MKNLTKTLAGAAATVASTALLASTVAMETATAATFTLRNTELGVPDVWTIESSAESVAGLWEKIFVEESWEEMVVLVNGEELDGGVSSLFLFNGRWDGWIGRIIGEKERSTLLVQFRAYGVPLRSVETTMDDWVGGDTTSVPEPSGAIALGVLGLGAVASRLRRHSK